MNIINATLRRTPGLYTVSCEGERISAITLQPGTVAAQSADIDAQGQLLIAPFVEPHIHLDAALTAGQPEWNLSGTLFEGIERWAQRKETITHEDTKQRAHATLRMLAEHGIQHVRTHIDVTDPTLAALRAMGMNFGTITTVAVATAFIAGAAHPGEIQAGVYAAAALCLAAALPLIGRVSDHRGAW